MGSRERLQHEGRVFLSTIEHARKHHPPDWMLELLVEQLELRREALDGWVAS